MSPRAPTSAPPTPEMKVRFGTNLARCRPAVSLDDLPRARNDELVARPPLQAAGDRRLKFYGLRDNLGLRRVLVHQDEDPRNQRAD